MPTTSVIVGGTTTIYRDIDDALDENDTVDLGITSVIQHLVHQAGFMLDHVDYMGSRVSGSIIGGHVTARVNHMNALGDKQILVSAYSERLGDLGTFSTYYECAGNHDQQWATHLFESLSDTHEKIIAEHRLMRH